MDPALLLGAARRPQSRYAVWTSGLALAPGDGVSSSYSEVAHSAIIRASADGDLGKVRLRLIPDETQIVKLTRTW